MFCNVEFFFILVRVLYRCEFITDNNKKKIFHCQELDIAAVQYLMDSMEPNELCIDKSEGQTQWIQNVQRYRPIVERLIQEYPDAASDRHKMITLIK